jgi:hypothetical protein
MANDKEKSQPPVLAFKSFRSAIQGLRAHGLPSTIDRSAWNSRSGTEQTQILAAMRFLGLLDEKGATQERLKELVAMTEDSAEEKAFWGRLLQSRYDKAFALDLATSTPNQLDDAIEQYGEVKGVARKRAVRFFLKAATHAGIKLSPRLTANMREHSPSGAEEAAEGQDANTSQTPKSNGKPRKKTVNRPPAKPPFHEPEPSNAMKTIKLPNVEGTLSVTGTFNPFLLMGDERALVYQIIDLMTDFETKAAKVSEQA